MVGILSVLVMNMVMNMMVTSGSKKRRIKTTSEVDKMCNSTTTITSTTAVATASNLARTARRKRFLFRAN
jgi:hypothetical protein